MRAKVDEEFEQIVSDYTELGHVAGLPPLGHFRCGNPSKRPLRANNHSPYPIAPRNSIVDHTRDEMNQNRAGLLAEAK